ncbi:MAG: efflux RND transporter periplasmic adaptor subunit [Chloroflexi bacterium]|nr:efflux RND transporter periplasmic adaptor subunit [Chloroflexota bacterium]
MQKRTIWIILVIVLAAAAIFGFSRWNASRTASSAAPQTSLVQRGDLQAIVGTSGTVRAAQSMDLTFGVAGTVVEILVAEGDKVTAGQPLARLDTTTLETQVASAELSLRLAEKNLADLKSPPTKTEIAQAEAALASAKAAYEAAKAKPVEWQIAQAEAALEKARKALQDAQAAYDAVSWRPNIAMLPQASQLQQATEAYQTALDNYRIAMASVSDAPIKSAYAQMLQAQDAYDKLMAGPTEEELLSAEAQVTQAKLALDTARKNLDSATLKAPFDGTITAVNIITGQTVAANTVAMSIADLDHLQIQANLPEVDAVQVKVGQRAEITLDAISTQTISGQVSKIALIGTVTQGVVNYPVTIDLAPTDLPVKPGMTASINIIVDERKNVLMVPNRAIRSLGRNQGYYVEVMVEGQIIQLPVTIGLSNGTMTEVTGTGLREGDTVVVSTTTTTSGRIPGVGGIVGPMGPF